MQCIEYLFHFSYQEDSVNTILQVNMEDIKTITIQFLIIRPFKEIGSNFDQLQSTSIKIM